MTDLLPKPRLTFLLVFLGCAGAMAAALYMEHVMRLEPCPLCIFQRVMVISTGIVALIAAIHGSGITGTRVYTVLMTLTALGGASLAGRQLWLQSLPEDEVPACGPSLDYLLDVFPLMEVIDMVLSGDGSCAEVQWMFLGLSIPGWTMVGFIGLLVICGFLWVTADRSRAAS